MIANALSNLRSFFERHRSAKPVMKFSILYPSLMNMFQLLNTDIYFIRENVPADDQDVQSLAYLLKGASNPSAEHLEKGDNLLKVSLLSQHIREDGSCITYAEYTHTDPDKGDEDFVCLAISSLEHFEGRAPEFTVHFSFSAQSQPDGDTFALIIDHILCLKDDKLMEYMGADHHIEFYGSLAYANQAFLQLLIGQKIDCDVNQTWFKNLDKASQVVTSIRNRTADSLAKKITQLQTAPEIHTPQAPT
jgi:hypothetical protein